jgi:hypothetical protein
MFIPPAKRPMNATWPSSATDLNGCLLERQVVRDRNGCVFAHGDEFRECTVERAAQLRGRLPSEWSIIPARKNRERDAVTDFDPCHALAELDNVARAIR